MLVGCNSVKDVIEDPSIAPLPRNIVLQGTISGLGTRRPVVLQYNGQDSCTDTTVTPNVVDAPCRYLGIPGQASSTFSFGSLPEGTPYRITVKTNPFGKLCEVTQGEGVLGQTLPKPVVTCVNDPSVPRYPVTVRIAPEVAAIQSARVRLFTEEGVQEKSAFGATSLTFPEAVFNSDTHLPIFKWFVTATSTVGSAVNNCHVRGGTNESLDAQGQDTTVAPTGPVDDVEVLRCSFTVSAAVSYLAAAGQPVMAMPPGGMELALRRSRTGQDERKVELQAFSTVSMADVSSNSDAIHELVITRQPEGMTCVVGSSSQYQWGSAVLLLEPLDANRPINHGWITSRNVRCRALAAPEARLRGTYRLHTVPASGGTATPSRSFLTFFEDGTYLYVHHAIGTVCSTICGVEHGFYVYDVAAGTISFSPTTDTNGASGLSTTATGFAAATPLTNVQRFPGFPARIEADLGAVRWQLVEPAAVEGQMTGAWATADHRRIWIFDAANYNGMHAGVNGLGNAQDGCFNLEDVHAPSGTYMRRGNATTCALGAGYFTLDVPSSGTVPRHPEGFMGKWPQSTSNADGRPSSPVNYQITPGTPDMLRIRETVNGSETLDGITPVSPEVILYRLHTN